jgi:hypothetical protein
MVGTGAVALAILLSATAPVPERPRDHWDWEGARIELMLGFGRRVAPTLARLHLVDLTFVSPARRFELTVPFVVIEGHRHGPSGKLAAGYSVLTAPLLFIGSAVLLNHTDSTVVNAITGTLLWLEGGSIAWTPGGQGNIHRAGPNAASLALVARNQLGLFGDPLHLRETLALGLALRVDDRADWSNHWPLFVCGAGVFGSVARDRGGAGSRDAGVWVWCAAGYMPIE